jgi:hypothetical protein
VPFLQATVKPVVLNSGFVIEPRPRAGRRTARRTVRDVRAVAIARPARAQLGLARGLRDRVQAGRMYDSSSARSGR